MKAKHFGSGSIPLKLQNLLSVERTVEDCCHQPRRRPSSCALSTPEKRQAKIVSAPSSPVFRDPPVASFSSLPPAMSDTLRVGPLGAGSLCRSRAFHCDVGPSRVSLTMLFIFVMNMEPSEP